VWFQGSHDGRPLPTQQGAIALLQKKCAAPQQEATDAHRVRDSFLPFTRRQAFAFVRSFFLLLLLLLHFSFLFLHFPLILLDALSLSTTLSPVTTLLPLHSIFLPNPTILLHFLHVLDSYYLNFPSFPHFFSSFTQFHLPNLNPYFCRSKNRPLQGVFRPFHCRISPSHTSSSILHPCLPPSLTTFSLYKLHLLWSFKGCASFLVGVTSLQFAVVLARKFFISPIVCSIFGFCKRFTTFKLRLLGWSPMGKKTTTTGHSSSSSLKRAKTASSSTPDTGAPSNRAQAV